MKRLLKIILLLLVTISLTGCNTKEPKIDTDKKLTDAEKFKEEYESINGTTNEKNNKENRSVTIPKDNPIIYKSAEELSEIIDNKETFVVYFGFKDCPWCRSVVEELIKLAQDKNIKKLYYVDVREIRDTKEIDEEGNIKTSKEGSKGYMELIDKLKDVLDDYTLYNKDEEEISVGEKRIYAPNVVAVSRGKAIELATGESDDLKDPYQELTEEMRKDTYKKLECVFKCLEESSASCKKNSC